MGKLEIISIVGWLGITLVKGFSFVVPIIAANSLPWVGQATTHMFVYYLSTINSTESLEYFENLITIGLFLTVESMIAARPPYP